MPDHKNTAPEIEKDCCDTQINLTTVCHSNPMKNGE